MLTDTFAMFSDLYVPGALVLIMGTTLRQKWRY